MTANMDFQPVKEWNSLRGFANLFRKESRAWWATRRWWINALLWTGMIGGLTGLMLFIMPSIAEASGDPNIETAGGPLAFGLQLGRSIFFDLGTLVMAIGVVVLCMDMIVEEKQSGLAEWLLSKPIARRSYVLAKICATLLAVLVLVIALPALAAYAMLSLRMGMPYPIVPFLSGIGVMVIHTWFYLTLTAMLGTLFVSRPPILGIALGMLFGGNLAATLFQPLLYVMPWSLGKMALLVAEEQALPAGLLWLPIFSTTLWSLIFILVAVKKFETTEF
jgi:ABC-2 type transport system permease protein